VNVQYIYIQNFLIIKKIKLLYNLTYFSNHVKHFLEVGRFIKFYIIILYKINKTSQTREIFQKQSILEKNVSYKSCRV